MKKLLKPFYIPLRHLYYFVRIKIAKIKISEFNDNIFYNKKIIVIGPAESSLSYLSGEEIDKFDLVIRVNKSHLTLSENYETLGTRTDILYHCCHSNPINGCGLIDVQKLLEQKNAIVIYPYNEFSELFRFYKCLLTYKKINLMKLNPKYYNNIKEVYSGKMPTTGYQVLNHLMKQQFKELHIVGFTFLKTPYISGYRDSHRNVDEINALVKKSNNHNPDAEFELFYQELISKKDKAVFLDTTLEMLIEERKLADIL